MDEASVIDGAGLEVGRDLIWRERLEALFDAHHERLYRLARRLSQDPDEARDLVQEAFLRAARRPSSVPRDTIGAESWLVRVLVNLCRDLGSKVVIEGVETVDELKAAQDTGADYAQGFVLAMPSFPPPRVTWPL